MQVLARRIISTKGSLLYFRKRCQAYLRQFCFDGTLIDDSFAPFEYSASASVYRDFVSPLEEEIIIEELQQKLKRSRYQHGHWDSVIIGYRETELFDESFLSKSSQSLLHRTREQLKDHLQREKIEWLPTHCIELKEDGELKPHVDSVRFSGDLVAGLSFLSPAIMRLAKSKPETSSDDEYVDLLLPPRSLYVLTGPSRYLYTHELLPSGALFRNERVQRGHRISLIFRDAKTEVGPNVS